MADQRVADLARQPGPHTGHDQRDRPHPRAAGFLDVLEKGGKVRIEIRSDSSAWSTRCTALIEICDGIGSATSFCVLE